MKRSLILILLFFTIGCSERTEQVHLNAVFNLFSLKAPAIKDVIYYSNQSNPADVDAQGAFKLSKESYKEIKKLCLIKGKNITYLSSISSSHITDKFETKLTNGCEFVISNTDDKIIIYIDKTRNIMLYIYIG